MKNKFYLLILVPLFGFSQYRDTSNWGKVLLLDGYIEMSFNKKGSDTLYFYVDERFNDYFILNIEHDLMITRANGYYLYGASDIIMLKLDTNQEVDQVYAELSKTFPVKRISFHTLLTTVKNRGKKKGKPVKAEP